MARRFLALLLVLSVLVLPNIQAQADSTKVWRINLQDGSELVAHILTEENDRMTVRTLGGIQTVIERNQIRSMLLMEGTVREGSFSRRDPNETRLFFAPTGRSLKQGQGYFGAYEIFFPFVAVGITDFISVGAGISALPAAETQLFYVSPRVRPLHLDNLDVSLGILYTGVLSGEGGLGIAYGVGTYGDERFGITGGIGWGFSSGGSSESPTLLLGAEVRVTESIKLITENWILTSGNEPIISFGVRFFGDRVAGDFGLIRLAGVERGFPFLPWIGFVYNF